MKVFRFMCNEEFNKYKNGETLINNTIHESKTNSIGFCFFKLKDFSPEDAWKFFKGISFPDVCAVFEVDETKLKQCYGIYRDPNKSLYELMNFIPKLIKVAEYSTTTYNNKDFKLLRYTTSRITIFNKSFEWRKA